MAEPALFTGKVFMTNGISKVPGVIALAQSALIIAMVFLVPSCSAQEQPAVQERILLSAVPASVTGSAGGVGADDLVEVAVSYCPELSRTFV